ncbi:MAG: hypothetical protein M3O46_00440, partial [Myxococcota bacterium]|nr:hypothetical protein [Myxococcota bacterium]
MVASTIGIGIALACAGSTERFADAWPNGADNRPPSPFVTKARRGEVAVPTIERIEQMCALLTSCDKVPIPSSLFPADFQGCVKKMTDELSSPTAVNFSLTMRECGLQADSCASLGACALHGASADACRGRGPQGAVGLCDLEGRALTCWHEEVLAVRDCPRGGEQCVVVDTQAACTLGICPPTVKDDDRPRCSASGTHLLRCHKGRLASLDCTAFGLKCALDGEGAAGCTTNGPPCVGAGTRCEGNVEVGCLNGHEVRVDCNAGGLACAQSPGATSVAACSGLPSLTGGCSP